MKKALFIFIGLLIFKSSDAQYQSVLGDTNQYWKVYKVQAALGVEVYVDSLYLTKTIQYNNQEYTEIRSRYLNNTTFSPHLPFGYLREDTTIGRLWYLPDTFNQSNEHLVYDFTLAVGDTFDIPALGPIRFVVESRDTIAGKQKMVLKSIYDTMEVYYPFLKRDFYPIDTLVFIEGIGSSKGINNRLYDVLEPDILLCHFKNGIQTFQHELSDSLPFLGQCDTTTPPNMITSIEEKVFQEEGFLLFPNPSEGTVNLKFEKKLQSIEVYSLQGQKVQEINPKNRSWELPQQNGLYLIRIQDEEGKVYTEKVIRN